ncbi:MAG: ABC transporter permease [Chloroflexi bacterium]|nr:ABC transporter permease [Chloroflexota bacterium]
MSQYIARRLLLLIPIFIGITLLNFILMNMLPGDAVDALIDPRMADHWTPEQLQAKRASLGLDKPWPVRYVIWLTQMSQGNFGFSYLTQKPVSEELSGRLQESLKLQIISFLTAVIFGIALGIFSALRQYSFLDYLFTIFTYINISIPGFFYALMVVYVFAIQLRWFPSSGATTYGEASSFWGDLRYIVLPAAVLAIGGWAMLMRYCRASMLEVLHQEYLATARAKGLTERAVILRHALRNALMPVITVIGLSIPSLVSGSILVETVFGWPGMGYLGVKSVNGRDYPVLMAVTVIFSLFVLFSNLLTDIAYAVADPRIRYD